MRNLTRRLEQLTRRLPLPPRLPHLTVFLHEVGDDEPTGTTPFWNGVALDIRYHAKQPPTMPPGGPHKIILGPGIEV
jgi:hypothetical protein